MTGSDGGALGGERPGERTSVPLRRSGRPPDSAHAVDIPGPRPGFYPPPPTSPAPPASDARPSAKTRHTGTRRRPGPAPAQQQLMARISAGRKARQRRVLLMASAAMSALVLLAPATPSAPTTYLNAPPPPA